MQGVRTPPEMTFGFLIQLASNLYQNLFMQWWIQGGTPLFLYQNESRRAEKVFLETPPYLRVWMTTPHLI